MSLKLFIAGIILFFIGLTFLSINIALHGNKPIGNMCFNLHFYTGIFLGGSLATLIATLFTKK